jgi:hypothetical protein
LFCFEFTELCLGCVLLIFTPAKTTNPHSASSSLFGFQKASTGMVTSGEGGVIESRGDCQLARQKNPTLSETQVLVANKARSKLVLSAAFCY